MVRNLSEAISLFNTNSTKLHLLDLRPIENLISSQLYSDPNFLTFSEKFGPIMSNCTNLFSLLSNENFISTSTLQDCERIMKIFQQASNFYKYQKFLDLYTDKLLKSPIYKQTPAKFANLISFYNEFNMLPKKSLLKYLSGDLFNMSSRRRFCLTESLFSIYANLRLNEFPEYKMYNEMYDKILKKEIPNALKHESDIKFQDKINLCYSLSISDAWKYPEIWKSILDKLAQDISKEVGNLNQQNSIKLLKSLDGVQCFAPDLMLKNKEAIYEIYKNLHFDSTILKNSICQSKELNIIVKRLDRMNLKYTVNQVIEGHYTTQLLVEPKVAINCISSEMFVRDTSGEKTNLEIASIKYESNILTARGYRYLSIPEYRLRTYGNFYLEKIIQDNVIKPI